MPGSFLELIHAENWLTCLFWKRESTSFPDGNAEMLRRAICGILRFWLISAKIPSSREKPPALRRGLVRNSP